MSVEKSGGSMLNTIPKILHNYDINDIMLIIYAICLNKGRVQVTRGPSLVGGNFI